MAGEKVLIIEDDQAILKLLQRGLHVGKQLVLVYGLARRVPPAALWVYGWPG